MTAEDITRALSDGARAAAPFMPGVGKQVAEWASIALGLAADLATLGRDPAAVMTHVRSMLPTLAADDAAWNDEIRKHFGSDE